MRYEIDDYRTKYDIDDYTRQISTYLNGRSQGLSQEQITKDIFKVNIGQPNATGQK